MTNEQGSTFNPIDYTTAIIFPERLVEPDSWVEHIPFASYLINAIEPELFVELGTLSGNSYCAFCQAVKAFNLKTRCFAVVTWEGDAHTGMYGNEVWENLKNHHDSRYCSFSRLIRKNFDDASNDFTAGSINLLHIDGFHTYDAVRHDFETWSPKLSKRAMVLFHDTNVKVKDYGVYLYWDELKKQYPSFEFFHGHGLGVLAVGSDIPKPMLHLFEQSAEIEKVRRYFELLGANVRKQWKIQTDLVKLQMEMQLANERYQESISYYSSSKSWKITQPLRSIADIFRKSKKNPS